MLTLRLHIGLTTKVFALLDWERKFLLISHRPGYLVSLYFCEDHGKFALLILYLELFGNELDAFDQVLPVDWPPVLRQSWGLVVVRVDILVRRDYLIVLDPHLQYFLSRLFGLIQLLDLDLNIVVP